LNKLGAALEKGPMLSEVADIREEPDHPDEKYRDNFIIEVTI
jgi:hypothetical protein